MEEVAQRRSTDQLDGQDVLGMFLRTPDSQDRLMSDEEICDAMRTLLLGGHDTTASTLTWILERVSRYPDALSRLETAALDGDDEYLDAVIKEAISATEPEVVSPSQDLTVARSVRSPVIASSV